jgi:xylose dehydrogenase (NAD/NADP)
VIDSAFGGLADREITVDRGGMHATFAGPSVNEITEQFAYFATKILTGEAPEPDGSHGLTDMEVMTGIYEAADTNAQVTFE